MQTHKYKQKYKYLCVKAHTNVTEAPFWCSANTAKHRNAQSAVPAYISHLYDTVTLVRSHDIYHSLYSLVTVSSSTWCTYIMRKTLHPSLKNPRTPTAQCISSFGRKGLNVLQERHSVPFFSFFFTFNVASQHTDVVVSNLSKYV